ncbi:DUF6252 family protein [Dyadobacter sp. CY356]|uniref:DUF6252 family protein n=1 Tax=Dyadobacter sp. CY356 TaxID=2906442 RepID=UPI001F3E0040|nr:DUF6252 family protein [Dyadobacter sp. CY356]MCF0058606.1 DUF6252 family protein [Dyadobacter sp. CY356]
MKKLAILMLALGFFACKNEKDKESVNPESSSFSAEKNNEKWTGGTSLQLKSADSDTVSFFFVANHPNDEVLVINVKFDGMGVYPLNRNQAFYYTTIGGDVISSRYAMSSEDTGRLVITKYDTIHKEIEGNFEISLKKQSANPENNVDVLKFTNSSFKLKLVK